MTENKIKGDNYERFIKQLLFEKNQNIDVWLWKDIPEYNLREAGILGDWNKYRLNRNTNKYVKKIKNSLSI
jgi:hypothetical protein